MNGGLDSPAVARELVDRSLYGPGYANERLEFKRRLAVLWLRHHSRRGWVSDQVLKLAREAT